mmetsp:Transcript_6948/g.14398  ORF Transcript_6948/g.14398 Transcript_6948/m.14398 type:complete len:455 (-) Transcript_6948:1911-3275(-)
MESEKSTLPMDGCREGEASDGLDCRWRDLEYLLRRGGPFAHEAFTEDREGETMRFLREDCRVLVIGAGALGCELLKDLAYSGFGKIDVIDMDVIDLSNLNRQFLFGEADVGKPKAGVAAQTVQARISGVHVVPHVGNIMDFDEAFYRQFHLIVAGLDSIDARRWLNAMIVGMVAYDDDGEVDSASVIPLIDGGTEGFLGQARVIVPKHTACFECTLDLFPPAQSYPLCTIANTPRLPEHCIEYAQVILWPRERPFGVEEAIDADNPSHLQWIFNAASKRADEFGITGVTYRLTKGVTKNIIPAVASTNAIIAAACANEALKMVTYIAPPMQTYMMYNGQQGIYTYTYENERATDCPVCGVPQPRRIHHLGKDKLSDLILSLEELADIRSKKPCLRNSQTKEPLYFSTPPQLEEATRANLDRTLADLMQSGTQLVLTDPMLPFTRILEICLSPDP